MKQLKIIDPLKIQNKTCPVWVKSGDLRGFMGWGIKIRTNSNWNHDMIMRRAGFVCTQGWTYHEIPIEKYMKPHIILKFWQCKDIAIEERYVILKQIEDDLNLPWWRRMYDFPGIIGQAVGLRWINISFLNYCTERVASKARTIIKHLEKHPNPEDLDSAFKLHKRFEVLGYWFHSDL